MCHLTENSKEFWHSYDLAVLISLLLLAFDSETV